MTYFFAFAILFIPLASEAVTGTATFIPCEGDDCIGELFLTVEPRENHVSIEPGATDVEVFRMKAKSTKVELLLGDLNLRTSRGDIEMADSYDLWVDTDNNGTVDQIIDRDGFINTSRNAVSFASPEAGWYTVPFTDVWIVVLADIADDVQGDELQLELDTSLNKFVLSEHAHDGFDINGIELDGNCSENKCFLHVETADSVVLQFASSCTETDNGADKNVKGSVTANGQTKTDYCEDNRTIVEYSCLLNGAMMESGTHCDGECDDGRCVEATQVFSAVELNVTSPADQRIDAVMGQKNIAALTFTIESRSDKTSFDGLRIKTKQGWADDAKFTLFVDTNRDGIGDLPLSTGKSNGSREVTFDFVRSPYVIQINRTDTFTVKANLDPKVPVDILQVIIDAVVMSSPDSGIQLNSDNLSVNNTNGPVIYIATVPGNEGSVAVKLFPPSRLYVGDKDERILLMRFNIDDKEDQTFYSITLFNQGNARDGSLSNMTIYREGNDGKLTNTVSAFQNGKAIFTFDIPFTVLAGDLIRFEIRGDISDGGGKTFVPLFRSTDGVIAAGSIYGYTSGSSQINPSEIIYENNSISTPIIGDSEEEESDETQSGGTQESSSPSSSESTSDNNNLPLITQNYIKGYELDVVTPSDQVNWFTDTDTLNSEGESANVLARLGIIGGYPDGEFKGWKAVNRAEAAKFILYSRYDRISNMKNNDRFPDVVSGEWYEKFVMFAERQGIIKGHDDGYFRPADGVNTAEFLAMLQRAFGLSFDLPQQYEDVPSSAWYNNLAGIAIEYNLFPDRATHLNPGAPLTRKEVAIAINNLLTELNEINQSMIRSVDLGLRVNMPGSVQRFSSLVLQEAISGDAMYYTQLDIFLSTDNYALSTGSLPDQIIYTGSEEELTRMLNMSIAGISGGSLISHSFEEHQGYPSIKYSFSGLENGIRKEHRGFIVVSKSRVYTLITTPDQSDDYFSSFVILPGILKP